MRFFKCFLDPKEKNLDDLQWYEVIFEYSDDIDEMKTLWQDGPAYVRVFITILRDIFKEETVEYVLALIDEMLTGNWIKFSLFMDGIQ